MKLLYARYSPFSRKVRMALIEKNASTEVEMVEVDQRLSPINPQTELEKFNPLGKVPTLVVSEAEIYPDSRLICEALEIIFPERPLLPLAPDLRLSLLKTQVLADGVMDSSVAYRYETVLRAEPNRSLDWASAYIRKIDNALLTLDRASSDWHGQVDVGSISIASALGYLDFRIPEYVWRPKFRNLNSLLVSFEDRESFTLTKPN